ncbi:MAG: nucleotidyltransferase family protein [Ignavibacteriales bacterium]|nr:nucleotidyltransferase family protein [Ignavibacteriales bacterium]
MKQHNKLTTRNSKNGYKKYAKAIKAHWQIIQDKYKVKELGIFGSVVRGEQKKRSDIDILVDYSEIPDLLEFISLENYLKKILKKKVDLVDKQGIRPELKDIILGEVIYI